MHLPHSYLNLLLTFSLPMLSIIMRWRTSYICPYSAWAKKNKGIVTWNERECLYLVTLWRNFLSKVAVKRFYTVCRLTFQQGICICSPPCIYSCLHDLSKNWNFTCFTCKHQFGLPIFSILHNHINHIDTLILLATLALIVIVSAHCISWYSRQFVLLIIFRFHP